MEKVRALVVRSTFGGQKCEKLTGSEHCWKFRCSKSARRCGTKHISKSTCPKHVSLGAPLEVEMFKKCTSLWHVVARSTFPGQKWKKLTGTEHFWTFRCRFAWPAKGIVHLVKSEQT